MNPNNNNNNNRLHLNFGYNDRNYNPANNNHVFPTTPSAFPQPLYQGQDYMDAHAAQNQAYGQNYYYLQQQQQAHYAAQQQQYAQHHQMPQSPYGNRVPYNHHEATNGLIQQFSNQDLSASPALSPRTASPAQRPRTAGSNNPQQQQQQVPLRPKPGEEEELPRYPEKYSDNVRTRGKVAKELVNVFFQENIERARERNMRYV